MQILVSVPADAEVDLDGVTVTVDGTDRRAAAAELPTATTTVRRTAVLAIDTSNSMHGGRFDAAKVAARHVHRHRPRTTSYVGIVTFAGEVTTRPGADAPTAPPPAPCSTASTLTKETRLYDGVIRPVGVAGTEGQRSLLVLSDGADTSDTPLEDVTTAIADAEVLVDVVALEQDGEDSTRSQQLATAGQGQVITADPAALQAAFAAEADVLARQVLVTAQVPAPGSAKTEATVKVTLPTATGSTSPPRRSRPSEPGDAAPRRRRPPTAWTRRRSSWALYAGLGRPRRSAWCCLVVLLVPRKRKRS